MTSRPKITESSISSYFSPTILGRGKGYVRKFAIFEAFTIGHTLRARCKGSYRNSYEVKAAVENDAIVSSRCSCPVGEDGSRCKHVAALLLTYLERPRDFKNVDEQETDLSRRSKEELIDLIGKMLARHPGLERLLTMKRPKAGEVSSMEEYERQLEEYKSQAISEVINCGDEYGASMELATGLEQIEHLGDRLLDAKDVAGASAVFEGVCRAVTENYKDCIYDEEGEIADTVNECAEKLASCFVRCKGKNDALRNRLLRVLYDIFEWDIRYGGVGIGDDVPRLLIDHATEDEMRQVADWAWTLLEDSDNDWVKEHIAHFILTINGDALDDETFLELCALGKDPVAKVKRLLKLGRLNDAEKEARNANTWHLVRMGDVFVEAGEEETIEQVMKAHLTGDADSRLADWLKKYYDRRRRPADALAMAQEVFLAAPSIESYEEVRRLSNQQGDWLERRPELLRKLSKRGGSDLLARIHMREGEWDDAIAIAKTSRGWGRYSSLSEEIAEAIEKERPEQSIGLFVQRAEELIGWRGRDNYRQAAAIYAHVSQIYDRLGTWAEWEKFLDGLLTKNDRLRAFKQELEAAGLIRTAMQ